MAQRERDGLGPVPNVDYQADANTPLAEARATRDARDRARWRDGSAPDGSPAADRDEMRDNRDALRAERERDGLEPLPEMMVQDALDWLYPEGGLPGEPAPGQLPPGSRIPTPTPPEGGPFRPRPDPFPRTPLPNPEPPEGFDFDDTDIDPADFEDTDGVDLLKDADDRRNAANSRAWDVMQWAARIPMRRPSAFSAEGLYARDVPTQNRNAAIQALYAATEDLNGAYGDLEDAQKLLGKARANLERVRGSDEKEQRRAEKAVDSAERLVERRTKALNRAVDRVNTRIKGVRTAVKQGQPKTPGEAVGILGRGAWASAGRVAEAIVDSGLKDVIRNIVQGLRKKFSFDSRRKLRNEVGELKDELALQREVQNDLALQIEELISRIDDGDRVIGVADPNTGQIDVGVATVSSMADPIAEPGSPADLLAPDVQKIGQRFSRNPDFGNFFDDEFNDIADLLRAGNVQEALDRWNDNIVNGGVFPKNQVQGTADRMEALLRPEADATSPDQTDVTAAPPAPGFDVPPGGQWSRQSAETWLDNISALQIAAYMDRAYTGDEHKLLSISPADVMRATFTRGLTRPKDVWDSPRGTVVAETNVSANRPYAHLVLDFKRTLSPLELVPSVELVAKAITLGREQIRKDVAFLTRMLAPLPML